jgi:hypothetical protein
MESFNDVQYIAGAMDWIKTSIVPIFDAKASILIPEPQLLPRLRLQYGRENNHCGVYCMALGLNYVMGTLTSMGSRLLPSMHLEEDTSQFEADTSQFGLELRKMAAWDAVQDPPLLDACLCMCPSFDPFPGISYKCNPWWRCVPYDLRQSLNVVLNTQDKFLMSGFSQNTKRGSHFEEEKIVQGLNGLTNKGFQFSSSSICNQNGKVITEGPFFFSNDEYFVKVHLIGLLDHFQTDQVSISRAAAAFQEAAASSYVCPDQGWWCQTFGLIRIGLSNPSVFVCIARRKLQCPANVDSPAMCLAFCNLAESETKPVLHNDTYAANTGTYTIDGCSQLQLHDFERTSRLEKISLPQLAIFVRLYNNSLNTRTTVLMEKLLMPQIRESGLNDTHKYFAQIFCERNFLTQAFDSDAFDRSPATSWRYCAWLHLMELVTDPELKYYGSENRFVISCCLHTSVQNHSEDVRCELEFSPVQTGSAINILSCKLNSGDNIVSSLICKCTLLQESKNTVLFFNSIHNYISLKKGCNRACQFATETPPLSSAAVPAAFQENPEQVLPQATLQQVLPTEVCLIGLPNIGNSCYMNACLQCLMHTDAVVQPFLASGFVATAYIEKHVTPHYMRSPPEFSRNLQPEFVVDLFRRLLKSMKANVEQTTSVLKEMVAHLSQQIQTEKGGQDDVLVFFELLCRNICPATFCIRIETFLSCPAKHMWPYLSDQLPDLYLLLPIPPGHQRVQLSYILDLYFQGVDVEVNCRDGECSQKQGRKQDYLADMSENITLGLKRVISVQPDDRGRRGSGGAAATKPQRFFPQRLHTPVDIPEVYDFGKYFYRPRAKPVNFRLCAVACQVRSSQDGQRGHYVAYCRVGAAWQKFDDDRAVQVDRPESMFNDISSNGSLFFFRRIYDSEPLVAIDGLPRQPELSLVEDLSPSPSSLPARFPSLQHLMFLLSQRCQQLLLLSDVKSSWLSFRMLMYYQSEGEEPFECKIFLEVCDDQLTVSRCDHCNDIFNDNFASRSIWPLNTVQDATVFYQIALSLFEPESFESDDSEQAVPSVPKKKSKKRKPQGNSETLESTLDRQFSFLARSVSADVWNNCVSSINVRFPQYQVRTRASPSSSPPPKSVLHYSHLGLKIFIIPGPDEKRCINFIAAQKVLTFDTETAYPRFPEQGARISLLQIGTNVEVYLIQVAKVGGDFLGLLRSALVAKTLVHWGGSDKDDVRKLFRQDFQCQWYDLQAKVSPNNGQQLGLDTCIYQFLKRTYSLSKEWTLSGWDLDTLHDCQIAYAALDVACCHLFYLHHEFGFAIFKFYDTGFHSFFTPKTINKGSPLDRHGLSFEPDFCCHFEHDIVVQGLFKSQLQESALTPKGFKACSWSEASNRSMVSLFVEMLNSKKFCCRYCSDLNWFEAIKFPCTTFNVTSSDHSRFSFRRAARSIPNQYLVPFPVQCSEPVNRDAYLCLSMLGTFLKCKLGAINVDINVVNSVLADCRFGFISCTLSYFQQ